MIYVFGNEIYPIKFQSGEVQLPQIHDIPHYDSRNKEVTIYAHIFSSDDVMILLQLKELLDEYGFTNIHLCLSYTPYGRYDRPMFPGDVCSLKVFARLINSLEFRSVYVFDTHSTVTEALFDRCIHQTQWSCVDRTLHYLHRKYDYIVSPDLGALKKVQETAEHLSNGKIIMFHKQRNLDGKIVSHEILNPNDLVITDKTKVLVVDDICDGGATFISIAAKLDDLGINHKDLYVTHGLFTKGKEILEEAYDNVFCFKDHSKFISQ